MLECVHAGMGIVDNAESMLSLLVQFQMKSSSSWKKVIMDRLETMPDFAPGCWE